MNKRIDALALLPGVCVILVYLPVLNNGFVNSDDGDYIYANSHLAALTGRYIQWAFTTFDCGNWHPLTWLSYGLDRILWGMRPMGFHATNIILHGLNTALVTILTALFIVTAKNTSNREAPVHGSSEGGVLIAAAATGILFGFHPIHVESVAWISERKDVLYAFFYLSGTLAYLRYVQDTPVRTGQGVFFRGFTSRFYCLALLLFTLSLLSKPMAVTFPVVLLILDWHPLDRFERGERRSSVLLEKLPFFALSLASSFVTIAPQKYGGAVAPLAGSFFTRMLVGTQAFAMYLWKMLVPLNLVPYYPYPRVILLLSTKYLAAFLIAASIAVSCIVLYRFKKGRSWIAAWCYYLVTLFPVLGFI